jgi:2-amino-1-hydroxyethylphosphonate dioxygenase (glycine-forming)
MLRNIYKQKSVGSSAMARVPGQTAANIIDMLNTRGRGDYIGEPISQLAHSLQAAHLASTAGADNETVIAALLHDCGQFLDAAEVQSIAHEVRSMDVEDGSAGGVGRVGHERIGEEYLMRLGFSQKVGALVGSHVAAKRYLCAVDPAYHDTLSDASKKSLVFQGGPMQGQELAEWTANPWCAEMCQLRKWDDAAKVVGMKVEPAETYLEMIQSHLEGRRA